MKKQFYLFYGIVILLLSGSFYSEPDTSRDPYFVTSETPVADSITAEMSLDEKIGRLLMVAAYSNRDSSHLKELESLIANYHVGGLIFFQGGPMRQFHMTRYLQNRSRYPLMVAMDAEWGLSMRLDSTMRFPRAGMLAATDSDSLVFEFGKAVGEQLKALNVHVSFAPVADVNNNPRNPVIGSRSFGEDKLRVTRLSLAYAKGLSAAGIIPVAKHFPGHGDTHVDSHKDLPVLPFDRNRIKNTELVPFKALIDSGVSGIMTAHLHVPSLDARKNVPASLSKNISHDLLREELGFKGLVFSDALNMKGVTKYYRPGKVETEAFLAGNDVLVFPTDVPKAFEQLKKEVSGNDSLEAVLTEKVHRILKAMEQVGAFDPVEFESEREPEKKLTAPKHEFLNRELNKKAQTLVVNQNDLLPLADLEHKKIGHLAFGEKEHYRFEESLQFYERVKAVRSNKKPTSFERKLIREELKDCETVIVSLHDTKMYPTGNFGVTKESLEFIEELNREKQVILVHFGSPYALAALKELENLNAVLIGYEEGEFAQHYAAEVIFGAAAAEGVLPVSINDLRTVGSGLNTKEIGRLSFSNPMAVGLDPDYFEAIDHLVQNGMIEQAYPGAQVLVAKDGKVIYHKAFGKHRYERGAREVKLTDVYDVASVTKVAATTAALMILNDEGKISIEDSLGVLLPEFTKGTEYASLKIKDVLTHRAGFVSWIPFYQRTLSGGVPRFDVYSMAKSDVYPHRVAENFYIHKDYPDSILTRIVETPLKNKDKDYKYSDLGYFFMQRIIEKVSGKGLDELAEERIYKPLGMGYSRFKPYKHFDLENIVPTEYDVHFRKQLIHGDVHDPAAAMLGGVGGHAGLFSNAADMAKYMQALINGGIYGGKRVFSKQIIEKYTDCLYCANPDVDNRRGIGFDKPVRDDEGGPTCQCISYASFGHTGFTGTMIWGDPEENIVLVFLSNRIYPSASNTKLIKMNIRTDVMQTVYDAVEDSKVRKTGIEDLIPELPVE